VYQYVI
jgi:hypothetical protein